MCECREKLDAVLAEKNARIAMALQVTGEHGLKARMCIGVEKIDKTKRKPVPTVVANYCPFCGEALAA